MKPLNLLWSWVAAPRSARRGFVAAGIAAAMAAGQAHGAITVISGPPGSVTYEFDSVLTGGTPGGTAPWVVVTFTDSAPNTVTANFSVPASGLDSGEFLTKFFFNYNSELAGGTFAMSPTAVTVGGGYDATVDSFKFGAAAGSGAGAGFSFDLLIDYATAGSGGGAGRLKAGESVSFDIVYTPSVSSPAVFNATDLFEKAPDKNDGSPGPYAEAHLQGIDSPNPDLQSSWIVPGGTPSLSTVPEPGSSLALICLLSAGLALRGRRRR